MARILVADDDADIRLLVAMRLQSDGHEVTDVADGVSAMQAFRDLRPDLVLLDVMMPGLNGLDVCREIRSHPDLSGTPVILLTARTQSSDREAGMSAGASDFVTKPFSPRDLATRVLEVLQR